MTPSQSLRNMETGVHLTVQKYRGEYKKKLNGKKKAENMTGERRKGFGNAPARRPRGISALQFCP